MIMMTIAVVLMIIESLYFGFNFFPASPIELVCDCFCLTLFAHGGNIYLKNNHPKVF